MENKTLEKTMDLAGSVAKIAANLSEKKEPPKPIAPVGDSDNSNKASTGSQNIQIHMGDDKTKEPPVEKHIHEFPEHRPLTNEECDLALKKAQMDFDLKKRSQDIYAKIDDREWKYKLEKEKKDERKGKIRRIIGGILVALGVSAIGYSVYADYRDNKGKSVAPTEVPKKVDNNATGGTK